MTILKKITIRDVPDSLHARLVIEANRSGKSMNAYLLDKLSDIYTYDRVDSYLRSLESDKYHISEQLATQNELMVLILDELEEN